jgi:hypothetical protein
MYKYAIFVDNLALFQKLSALVENEPGVYQPSAAPVPPSAPGQVLPPAGPPAPPAAPAAPAAPPPPPANTAPKGQPKPGWTIDHVKHALNTLAQRPGAGAAAVQAILTKYGAATVADIDPAQWDVIYNEVSP